MGGRGNTNQAQWGAMNQKSMKYTVLEPHKYTSIMASTKTYQCTGHNTASKDTSQYMGTIKMLLCILS